MPQLDTSTFLSQIVWLIICFGGLVFCYVRIFIPRFNRTIENRLSRIHNDIEQASLTNKQAQILLENNQQKLDAAHQQVEDKIKKTLDEMDKKKQSQLAHIDEELSSSLEAMQKSFERRKESLNDEMNKISVECVDQIMTHLINKSSTSKNAPDKTRETL